MSEEIIEKLRGNGAMKRFDDAELAELVAACELRTLQPREALWAPDTQRSDAFILVDGRLERSHRSHAGRESMHYTEPGSFLSVSSLVKPWPYHGTCVALDRSRVLALSRASFIELFEDKTTLSYKIVDAIGEYLVADMRKANERLQDVFGRPAETLMMLRRRIREDSKA